MGDFENFGDKDQFGGLELEPLKPQNGEQPANPEKPALDGKIFQVGDNGDSPPIQTRERGDIGQTGSGEGSLENPPEDGGGDAPPGENGRLVVKDAFLAQRKVLAFVSDLHLGLTPDDFDRTDQVTFVNMLRWLRGLNKKVTLVLLGDIIEVWESANLNQLAQAQSLAIDYARLYTGGVPLPPRQLLMINIIRQVLTTHKPVVDALAEFVAAGNELFYLFGNHDDEIAKNPLYKSVISSFIPGIQFRPDSGLADGFLSQNEFSLFATHGHSLDATNLAMNPERAFSGNDRPLGRVIVEEFLVKMEALEVRGQRPFSNLDEFEPLGDYYEYYLCKINQLGLTAAERRSLEGQIEGIIDNLIREVEISDVFDNAKTLSRKFGLVSGFVADFIAGLFVKSDALKGFSDKAKGQNDVTISLERADELRKARGDVRCIVMGHTHEGFIEDLPSGNRAIYINTGTWMNKFKSNSQDPCNPLSLDSQHVAVLTRTVVIPERSIFDDLLNTATARVVAQLYTFQDGSPRELQAFRREYNPAQKVLLR